MKRMICLLCLIAFALPLRAQTPAPVPSVMIGVGGGVQFAWHSGDVTTSDGAYDCCTFTDGNGTGFAFSARGLFQLSNILSLRASAGLEQHNGEFSSVRLAYPILSPTNSIEYADLDEALEVRLSTLTIEAQLQYMLLSPGLYLSAGPALHLPMTKAWTHTETIAAPSDLRYIDGSKSKVLLDGDIPDAGAFMSLRFGAGALIPISNGIFAPPEMLYSFAQSDVQSESAWSVSGFQLTIGVYVGI